MKNKKLAIIICFSLILALVITGCTKPVNENTPANGVKVDLSIYKNGDIFITPEELKEKLSSGDVVILDSNKVDKYAKEHIPGAISMEGFQKTCITLGKPGDKGWGTVLGKEELTKVLESLGIDNKKTVVFYSDVMNTPGPDGRYAWQLRASGLDNVKMLYGGLAYWKQLGYDTTTEVSTPIPTTGLVLKDFEESYRADTEYVSQNLDKMKIIDIRTEKEYKGSQAVGEARGGHIKGAISLEWKQLMNFDATLKKPDEIIAIMKNIGVSPEDEFVVY